MNDEKINVYIDEYSKIMYSLLTKKIHERTVKLGKGEGRIILYLYGQTSSVSSGDLSTVLHVGTGRIGNALKNLEKKGFIFRIQDEIDKRKTNVKLTAKGIALAEEKKRDLKQRIIELVKFLGEEDSDEFLRILKKLLFIAD